MFGKGMPNMGNMQGMMKKSAENAGRYAEDAGRIEN